MNKKKNKKPTLRTLSKGNINQYPLLTAGVDEAGRGPLAGPVYAAAVILDPNKRINGLADSKILTIQQRETLEERIKERALCWSVAFADHQEIDSINIFQATMLAMQRAVAGLSMLPEFVLVDGKHCPILSMQSEAIVKGDASVKAISAASILAKVARDRVMISMDDQFPGYGFAEHKGYSTVQHLKALQELGATPIHRRSFEPVFNQLNPQLDLFIED